MFAHEAGQTLVAKLRGPARQRSPRRGTIPTKEATVVTELVQITVGKTGLLAQEAGLTLGRGVNGSGETRRQPAELFIEAEAGRGLIPLRRAEGPQPTPYEILGSMESPSPASGSDTAAYPSGVSAFIARVLEVQDAGNESC